MNVLLYNTFLNYCDAPQPWGVYFQDSASPQMEALVELHDNIMFYLVIILFGVAWIMVSIIRNYINNKSPISNKYLNHGTLIELIWTITPALILILIAFPYLNVVYLMDDISDTPLNFFGDQEDWYVAFEYHDITNNYYKDVPLLTNENDLSVLDTISNISSIDASYTTCNKTNFTCGSYDLVGKFEPLSSDNFNYENFMKYTKRVIDNNTNDYTSYSDNENGSFRPGGLDAHIDRINSNYLIHLGHWALMIFLANIAYYMYMLYLFSQLFGFRNNRFVTYFFLLLLQAVGVAATNIRMANSIITAAGWFLYINLMAWYDIKFKNEKSKQVEKPFIVNNKINFTYVNQNIKLGLLFCLLINIGVLFSTSFAFLVIPHLNSTWAIISVVLSYIVSALASTGWIMLTNRETLGYNLQALMLSYGRAFLESIAFTFLSLANFIIWNFVPQTRTCYTISFVAGLVVYFLVSYIQVSNETNLSNRVLYGFIYNFVFTSLSISSSGLYYLMQLSSRPLGLRIFLIVLGLILIILFPLEVYRFEAGGIVLGGNVDSTLLELIFGRQLGNNPTLIYIIGMLYQLLVFFSFALETFIWIDFTGLGG